MDDLISRSAAIQAFEPEHRVDWYTPYIIETLEQLPSDERITEISKWLDPDIDNELALERIREIVYQT